MECSLLDMPFRDSQAAVCLVISWPTEGRPRGGGCLKFCHGLSRLCLAGLFFPVSSTVTESCVLCGHFMEWGGVAEALPGPTGAGRDSRNNPCLERENPPQEQSVEEGYKELHVFKRHFIA